MMTLIGGRYGTSKVSMPNRARDKCCSYEVPNGT
jgi:hypothetical protein